MNNIFYILFYNFLTKIIFLLGLFLLFIFSLMASEGINTESEFEKFISNKTKVVTEISCVKLEGKVTEGLITTYDCINYE